MDSNKYVIDLEAMRDEILKWRRDRAEAKDLDNIIEAQTKLEVVERAIEDEKSREARITSSRETRL